jgi:hypothetical protein
VIQVFQDFQALLDDGVAFAALDVSNETDATGVMFKIGAVKALGRRQADAGGIDYGRRGATELARAVGHGGIPLKVSGLLEISPVFTKYLVMSATYNKNNWGRI